VGNKRSKKGGDDRGGMRPLGVGPESGASPLTPEKGSRKEKDGSRLSSDLLAKCQKDEDDKGRREPKKLR